MTTRVRSSITAFSIYHLESLFIGKRAFVLKPILYGKTTDPLISIKTTKLQNLFTLKLARSRLINYLNNRRQPGKCSSSVWHPGIGTRARNKLMRRHYSRLSASPSPEVIFFFHAQLS